MTPLGTTTNNYPTGLDGLVSTIGEEKFGSQLLTFFNDICGAEYCMLYHLNADAAQEVTTAGLNGTDIGNQKVQLYFQNQRWKRDPMIAQARKQLDVQQTSIVQTPIKELPFYDFRDVLYGRTNVCDRMILSGRSEQGIIALVLLRTSDSGAFTNIDIDHVQSTCSILMSVAGKHIDITRDNPNLSSALTSLEQIETCLTITSAPLSKREAQVCARILYGMTSTGIAFELGIGEETAMTYRKRAYLRLGIASQRELLLWYLDLWGSLHVSGCRKQ